MQMLEYSFGASDVGTCSCLEASLFTSVLQAYSFGLSQLLQTGSRYYYSEEAWALQIELTVFSLR